MLIADDLVENSTPDFSLHLAIISRCARQIPVWLLLPESPRLLFISGRVGVDKDDYDEDEDNGEKDEDEDNGGKDEDNADEEEEVNGDSEDARGDNGADQVVVEQGKMIMMWFKMMVMVMMPSVTTLPGGC